LGPIREKTELIQKMENKKIELLKNEIEELVISELNNQSGLILTKGDLSLKLKTKNDYLSGDVFLYGEFYENFRVEIQREKMKEKICDSVLRIFSEFGDLKDVIISGKRNDLENRLNGTTDRIFHLIKSRTELNNKLGQITIMVDEKYPYGETYENQFPIWQYEIKDTTQKLDIAEKLDFELNTFDEFLILKKVENEINEIMKEK